MTSFTQKLSKGREVISGKLIKEEVKMENVENIFRERFSTFLSPVISMSMDSCTTVHLYFFFFFYSVCCVLHGAGPFTAAGGRDATSSISLAVCVCVVWGAPAVRRRGEIIQERTGEGGEAPLRRPFLFP